MANDKNKYGQYMTPELVADFMISLANLNQDSSILEPSSGQGVFLDALFKAGYENITAFEIDKSIIKKQHAYVINESFVSACVKETFDLVIGNPPYIRWKNLESELKDELAKNNLWATYCNSLCDYACIFIIKAIELLKDKGQLIFITPEYWLNTTHSITLRNYMLENGYFEAIYHFNETPIFENATVSLIVFKFIKSKGKPKHAIKVAKYFKNKKPSPDVLNNLKNSVIQEHTEYIQIPQFEKNKNWILAPQEMVEELNLYEDFCKKTIKNDLISSNFYTVKDFCDIGNGMVSGLDKAFQVSTENLNNEEKKHIIKVLKAKDLNQYTHGEFTNYFMLNESISDENAFKILFPNIYNQLEKYKEDLNNRYQYSRKINYWEWVFPRNFKLFSKKSLKIFVPGKERISNKDHFRFTLVDEGIYPTQDVTAIFKKEHTEECIFYILALLNSKYVFDWLRFNGVVKGSIVEFSEKPIASIPYRKIDFNNNAEVKIHDDISNLTKSYIDKKNEILLFEINKKIDQLFQKRL